jgi:Na+-transporting NADH:ubiquinone oxidoreductase subunit NqrD
MVKMIFMARKKIMGLFTKWIGSFIQGIGFGFGLAAVLWLLFMMGAVK